VKPETYDAWYQTPRGQWIGTIEYSLLKLLLRSTHGSSLLDIGCGTGRFTRMFAQQTKGLFFGLDPNEEWLAYAQDHAVDRELHVGVRAEALPFADQSFDCTLSVTELCFVTEQLQAFARWFVSRVDASCSVY
jgi:ubiquinone/menaquinone biosynthesis C-methylase UbiE